MYLLVVTPLCGRVNTIFICSPLDRPFVCESKRAAPRVKNGYKLFMYIKMEIGKVYVLEERDGCVKIHNLLQFM
jgi:hypothetical protein